LYEAFDAAPPGFGHIPLILNADGSKMSKRDQGASIQEYQDEGYLPEAVVNYMALLGWSPKGDEEVFPPKALKEHFHLEEVNRANARFDLAKCEWLSGQYLANLDASALRQGFRPFFEAKHLPEACDLPDEAMLEIRDKVRTFSQAPEVVDYLFRDNFEFDAQVMEKISANDKAPELLTALATTFAGLTKWDGPTAFAAIPEAAAAVGVKKGALMFPFRVALSGRGGGLGLVTILGQLGQEKTIARLKSLQEKLAS
ncbi:MAG: glutamate--tRNA ligase family protein, partial [Verrucomicrobiota bacterium]